jgi:D-alanyl-D-alanine carboxypeptidase
MSKGAEEHTMERVAVQKRTMIGKAARCAGLCGVLALVGLVAAAAPASAARPASPAPKLQQAMEELVAAGVPGVVVLIREGDRTIRLSSGYGNLATKAPLRPTDRFRIASLTKTFVATVVLQLVEEGKLSLEDTVERWLPGVVPNGENITVRELLAHKSGLFDYSQDPRVLKPYLSGNLSYYWAPRRLVQIAVSHRPLFAPGTAVSYSSTGYVLLGLIVRAATGNPIGTELNRRLFKPLGLHATTFSTSGHIAGAHAHGYFVVPNRPLQDVTGVSPSWYWTAGNIVSTADDVARFYRALLAGRLLSRALLRTMETTTADRHGVRWGLGIATGRLPCGAVWGHDGAVPGYDSVTYNSKDGRRQIVVWANSVTSSDKVGGKRAQQAFGRVVNTAYCG